MSKKNLRVMHIHPKMGFGGVETYLYRLTEMQIRRGYEVGLLTAGGVFEERVAKAGVHLHKMTVSRENLDHACELIGNGRFDLIHAHNYRAARFGRHLAARLNTPFLMSVHGPRAIWHRLFFHDWSEWVVAMSEGDRDNITSLGGIARDRVLNSFYGIDTERFRPGLDTTPIREELQLPEDVVPVVLASRLANHKARVAQALMDAMPQVSAAIPGAVALVAGEGPESDRLSAHAQAVNERAGRQVVRMVGPRRDVELFMNLAAVFVGTANTALEAMACGAPTIAAGRTGHFGRVTTESFEQARALCFADHGHLPEAASAARFARELPALLADMPTVRRDAAALSALIAERYNTERMTDDVESIYHKVLGS